MLCPACKCNTLEPEYYERPNFLLADHPLFRNAPPPPIRELKHFRCGNCRDIFYVCAGESTEQAYWRIIRDYDYDDN